MILSLTISLQQPLLLLKLHSSFAILTLCITFYDKFCVFAQKWAEIIGQASQSVDVLKNQDVIRSVLNIMQVFCKN